MAKLADYSTLSRGDLEGCWDRVTQSRENLAYFRTEQIGRFSDLKGSRGPCGGREGWGVGVPGNQNAYGPRAEEETFVLTRTIFPCKTGSLGMATTPTKLKVRLIEFLKQPRPIFENVQLTYRSHLEPCVRLHVEIE